MNKLLRFFVCCFVLGVAAHALDKPAVAKQKYDALKARVLAGDATVDWRELRLAAEVGGVDGDFDWRDANKKAMAAYDKKDYAQMLKSASEITEHNIANPDGHFAAMVAYKYLEKPEEQAKEKGFVDAILKSILTSGDGKSAATAYFTVATSEEYFVLKIIGYRPKGQALVQRDGHAYDRMTVSDDDGKEHELWFNTDTDMQMMEDALGGGKNKK